MEMPWLPHWRQERFWGTECITAFSDEWNCTFAVMSEIKKLFSVIHVLTISWIISGLSFIALFGFYSFYFLPVFVTQSTKASFFPFFLCVSFNAFSLCLSLFLCPNCLLKRASWWLPWKIAEDLHFVFSSMTAVLLCLGGQNVVWRAAWNVENVIKNLRKETIWLTAHSVDGFSTILISIA